MEAENLVYGLTAFLFGIAFGIVILTIWQRRHQKESRQPKRLSKEEIARKTKELRISQSMGDRINDVDG